MKPDIKIQRWRVLDVGASRETSRAVTNYPNDEVITLNAPGLPCDVEMDLTSHAFQDWNPEPFDAIVCTRVLEHLTYQEAHAVLAKLLKLIKPFQMGSDVGQVLIVVPSLEWAAAMLRSENAPPAVLFHIYGAQSNPQEFHKWGYTLPMLRNSVRSAGFTEYRAGVGEYTIEVNGTMTPARENYVIGVRVDEQS